jgi:superoxide reductase
MEMKFYRCPKCGNIVSVVQASGAPLVCCGSPMEELIAGSVDASAEKHVPVWEVNGRTVIVRIGSAAHPMLPEHFIEWVAIRTKEGQQIKPLAPGHAPESRFALCEGDEVLEVYAYCNLHGLWKAE